MQCCLRQVLTLFPTGKHAYPCSDRERLQPRCPGAEAACLVCGRGQRGRQRRRDAEGGVRLGLKPFACLAFAGCPPRAGCHGVCSSFDVPSPLGFSPLLLFFLPFLGWSSGYLSTAFSRTCWSARLVWLFLSFLFFTRLGRRSLTLKHRHHAHPHRFVLAVASLCFLPSTVSSRLVESPRHGPFLDRLSRRSVRPRPPSLSIQKLP